MGRLVGLSPPVVRLCFAKRSSARSVPRRWRRLATGLAMPARHRASSHDVRPVPEPPWRTPFRFPHPGRPRTREPRLRQQLANLRRTSGRPRLRKSDRAFWLVLSRLWSRWADVLVVVKPDTVVRWHRAGFRLFWRWKSRSRSPTEGDVSAEVKTLIRQMADANVGWGAPRIHGELLKLGIDIGERSVSRWMPPKLRNRPRRTSSAPNLEVLLRLLPPVANASVAEQGRAGAATNPPAQHGQGRGAA